MLASYHLKVYYISHVINSVSNSDITYNQMIVVIFVITFKIYWCTVILMYTKHDFEVSFEWNKTWPWILINIDVCEISCFHPMWLILQSEVNLRHLGLNYSWGHCAHVTADGDVTGCLIKFYGCELNNGLISDLNGGYSLRFECIRCWIRPAAILMILYSTLMYCIFFTTLKEQKVLPRNFFGASACYK